MKYAIAAALISVAFLPAQAAKPAKSSAVATASVPAQSKDIGKIVGWLEKGKWEKARKRLTKVLEKTPSDSAARTLLRQIDTEPKALLGASSIPYLVRPGDSYQSLAQRHLGNPLMFFALARYNGVSVPSKIKVGTTLRIPSVAQAASEPKPASQKAGETKPRRAAKATKTKSAASEAPAPSAAVKSRSDAPALAGALRRQGLSALARGNPGGAVVLLERAAAADPGNRVVAADLARARRVRDAVR